MVRLWVSYLQLVDEERRWESSRRSQRFNSSRCQLLMFFYFLISFCLRLNFNVFLFHVGFKKTEDSVQEPLENVIFIHGFMGSSYFWTETVFEHVDEERYRLFAVDLLGFGESPKPRDSLYTLTDHVEAIERSVIKPYQVDSFHVVAHSMGCLIALALAAKHSTIVKSVTLVAPVRN